MAAQAPKTAVSPPTIAKKLDDDEAWRQRYLDLCEQEVKDYTGIQFLTRDTQGRPMLEYTFERGTGWTTERLVQVFFVVYQMDREKCFHLLVELYRDEPDHLYRQFQAARHMIDIKQREWYLLLASNKKSEAWDQDPRYEDALKALNDLDLDLGPTVTYPQFAHFLMDLQPVRPKKMASFKRLVTETAALVRSRFRQSEAFRLFIAKDWHPMEFLEKSNGSTPFVTGLRRILSSQLTRFQVNLIDYIEGQWRQPRHDKRLIQGDIQDTPHGQFDTKPFQLAFAPSGSGKTNAILRELAQRYGHYMVSSALPRPGRHSGTTPKTRCSEITSSTENNQNIFDPKVLDGVSRDTREMFEWLKYAQTLVAEQKDSASVDCLFFACFNWWQRIMETRHRVFQAFRKALGSHSTPALWLSFQLDCNERDPFLDIFQILALFHPSVRERAESYLFRLHPLFNPQPPSQTDNYGSVLDEPPSWRGNDAIEVQYPERSNEVKVQWTCIDEAQEDLQAIIADKPPVLNAFSGASLWSKTTFDSHNLPMNILAIAMSAIGDSGLYGTFPYFQQMIFTGTSLNVTKVLQSRESVLASKGVKMGPAWQKDACSLISDFFLVLNRSAAREVLRSYGLDGSEKAVEKGRSLWGRVKWTAMYAERIIDEIRKSQPAEINPVHPEEDFKKLKTLFATKKDSLNFDHLADDTYEIVIAELLKKLSQLQQRGDCERLLDKLLEAAISADILDRPHVLDQESDMELVEHGFAIVESWEDSLEAELTGDFKIVKLEGQIIATLSDGCDPRDAFIHLLDTVVRRNLAVVTCRINTLSADIMKKGFVIVDRRIDRLAAKLEEHGFAVSRQAGDELVVRLVNSGTNEPRHLDQLAAAVAKNGAFIENHTMDKLTPQIMTSGFTLWSNYSRDKVKEDLEKIGFQIIHQVAGCSNIKHVNAQENDKPNLESTTDKWMKNPKNKVVLFNENIDQLLTESSNNEFIIKADPAVREQLKKRLTGQKLQDCMISEPESRLLPAKSSEHATRMDQQKDGLLSNLNNDGFVIIDQDIESLVGLVRQGMTIMRPTNKLTADMWEKGFITWGGTAATQLETLLKPYTIIDDQPERFTVTGPSTHTLDSRDRLARELAKDGFPMVSKTKHSLILKLAERVVIDAVIRFALSHGQLDEKFAVLIRLVSGRSGLGHLSEHYLAVQLRQCLSTTWFDHSAGPENEWLIKRNTILTMLDKAKNGSGNTIESLDQYRLVAGRQTIRSNHTWDDWMNAFMDWLAAVREHETPNASFLFPHNDFGPDIIFALRKEKPPTDNNTVGATKDDVIVCSIQLKTGGVSIDAVNKSSVSWACNSARTKGKDELEKQKQPLEEARDKLENNDWNMKNEIREVLKKAVQYKLRNLDNELGTEGKAVINTASLQDLERAYDRLEKQPNLSLLKLSLLIATDVETREDLVNARPVTSPRDQNAEYYAFIGGEDAKAVFGEAFTTLLTTI